MGVMQNIPPCPDTVEGRVDVIAQALRDGSWDRKTSRGLLSEAWHIPKDTIHNYRRAAGKKIGFNESKENLVQKERGVTYIVALLEGGMWRHGTAAELAEMWGVSEGLVLSWRMEAGTRAKYLHPRRPDTQKERVLLIAQMIVDAQWSRQAMEQLAVEWDLSESSIRAYAKQAETYIDIDADQVKREITMGGLKVLRSAVERNDAKSFKFAADPLIKVAGLDRHKNVHHTVEVLDKGTHEARRLFSGAFGGTAKELPEAPPKAMHGDVIDVEAEIVPEPTSEPRSRQQEQLQETYDDLDELLGDL